MVTLMRYLKLDFDIIFLITGGMVVVFALLTPFLVVEPPDLQRKKQKRRLTQ